MFSNCNIQTMYFQNDSTDEESTVYDDEASSESSNLYDEDKEYCSNKETESKESSEEVIIWYGYYLLSLCI